MTGISELRIARSALPEAARSLRHALGAFLAAIEVDTVRRDDIVVAVGEALANAIEHAYGARGGGIVELFARAETAPAITVEVSDRGRFIEREGGTPGRGFGLRIVRAIARDVAIDVVDGTRIRMVFEAPHLLAV